MSKLAKGLLAVFLVAVVGCGVYFSAIPAGRAAWNAYTHSLQKADDSTLYETRKKVEDTCRGMQASYTADKMVWEQYSGSTDKEERSWGQQAMIRANKTAAAYNEYVLKNSYVWEDNVPDDIAKALDYLREEA